MATTPQEQSPSEEDRILLISYEAYFTLKSLGIENPTDDQIAELIAKSPTLLHRRKRPFMARGKISGDHLVSEVEAVLRALTNRKNYGNMN